MVRLALRLILFSLLTQLFNSISQDKQLTEVQISEFLKTLLLMDRDGDGLITMEDLKKVMKSPGQDLSEMELRDMIKESDTNGLSLAYYLVGI